MWIIAKILFSALSLAAFLRATYISQRYNEHTWGRNGDFDHICDTALFLLPLILGTLAVWFIPLW